MPGPHRVNSTKTRESDPNHAYQLESSNIHLLVTEFHGMTTTGNLYSG